MKKDMTLLVLAAGMGSRFGGLKQIEPVGPNGEFIIDYSIYDAIRSGFNKVVFVIKEENYDIFKETVGKRIEDKIKVEYAFQKLSDIPAGFTIPIDREKPLGTAHAVYAARDVINEDFVMINADDFYGVDAFLKAAQFLKNNSSDEYAIIGYEIQKTLTLNGSVKRGVVFATDNYLDRIVESSVELKDGEIIASPLNGDESFKVDNNTYVSMNMLCFTPKLFNFLNVDINRFLSNENLNSAEYLIPDVAADSAKENNKKIKIIPTTSKWYGMTYKEDLIDLKNGILEEINKGNYKKDLWG